MQYAGLQRAMTSGQHIFELMDIRPDITDKQGAIDLPNINGAIKFEHVHFHYDEGVPVLSDIDVSINSGEKIALVGATGAGKTTFVSLVSRFYDPTQGRITIDNIDVRDMTRVSFAKHTGTVTQDPFLFSGTIKDNIIFSHSDITDEHLVEASKTIGAHSFISRLEFGYNTTIEERGSNLSPGERQLISLTRAIIGNPSIVILDEATATVDSHTEKVIQTGLDNLLEGRTALIIAHRLSTVRNVDRIFVMDKGRIIEQGNHNELLSQGGIYAQLHSLNYASELLTDE
jgi:ATP-binding cassette subfamily B protein